MRVCKILYSCIQVYIVEEKLFLASVDRKIVYAKESGTKKESDRDKEEVGVCGR
jgi:hypothetical protein